MKRFLLSAALLAAATTAIQAHTLDGVVKDNKTGEPLIGTVIRVKELPNVSTTTGLDGTFTPSPPALSELRKRKTKHKYDDRSFVPSRCVDGFSRSSDCRFAFYQRNA